MNSDKNISVLSLLQSCSFNKNGQDTGQVCNRIQVRRVHEKLILKYGFIFSSRLIRNKCKCNLSCTSMVLYSIPENENFFLGDF